MPASIGTTVNPNTLKLNKGLTLPGLTTLGSPQPQTLPPQKLPVGKPAPNQLGMVGTGNNGSTTNPFGAPAGSLGLLSTTYKPPAPPVQQVPPPPVQKVPPVQIPPPVSSAAAPPPPVNGQTSGTITPTGTGTATGGTQGIIPPPVTPPVTFQSTVEKLGNFNPNQDPGYQQAQNAYQQAITAKNAIDQSYASQSAGISGNPGFTGYRQGQQGILDTNYQLASNKAQGAINQQQTAMTQAQAGTAQQQTALTNAAGYAAPQAANALGTYSPLNNQYTQYGGTSGGGAAQAGAVTEQANQGANVQNMEGAIQQSGALINKVKQDIQTSGFNPAPSAIGNALSSWINTGLFPNPAFQNVINGLNEIVTTIAPVLGVPGNPTDAKLFMSKQLVPLLMAGTDLPTVLDNLEANARVKINAARTASQSNAITNPSATTSANTQTNGQSNSNIFSW